MKSSLLLAFLVPLLAGCSSLGACGNDISQTLPSPDGARKAVVFSRDCGATTDFTTQISVLGASQELPDDGGNVLVLGRKEKVVLRWKDVNTLIVSYPKGADLFSKQSKVGGVRVVFKMR